MDYKNDFEKCGISVQEYIVNGVVFGYNATTYNGKRAYICECGSGGDKFSLYIDGKQICTRCNFRTAVKTLKTY